MPHRYTVEPTKIESLTAPKIPLVGRLFRPTHADETHGKPAPITIVFGPIGAVKEQSPFQYATRIAKLGTFVITFDHRYFGETGGSPDQFKHPQAKIEDLLSVIEFASQHSEFDMERLCVVGICQGVNWVVKAALQEPRIKRICLVAGHYLYKTFLEAFFKGTWNGQLTVDERIRGGEAAWAKYEKEKLVDYIPIVGLTEDKNRLRPPPPTYYYYTRFEVRVKGMEYFGLWRNQVAKMSEKFIWTNEVDKDMAKLQTPILIVVGEKAATNPKFVQPLFDAIPGKDKHLKNIGDHYTHVQFYDDPEIIDRAVAEIGDWVSFSH